MRTKSRRPAGGFRRTRAVAALHLVCRLAQDFGKGVKPAFNSTIDLSMPLPVLSKNSIDILKLVEKCTYHSFWSLSHNGLQYPSAAGMWNAQACQEPFYRLFLQRISYIHRSIEHEIFAKRSEICTKLTLQAKGEAALSPLD